jgi:hypothetical protein
MDQLGAPRFASSSNIAARTNPVIIVPDTLLKGFMILLVLLETV